MQLGYIGLGKMGSGMVERLLEKKHEVTVHDRDEHAMRAAADKGARRAASLADLAASLSAPRLVWLMVPHQAVEPVLNRLFPLLSQGDTVIDGGNSPFKDSIRRSRDAERQGVHFLDAGVSGGPKGARNGACIMIGGGAEVFGAYESLFRDLSAEQAYAYVGPSGAGHFVKMVHNGIEYGMMQALAEGFTVLKGAPFGLDLARVADLYNRRSVIESRLVSWLKDAYDRFGPELRDISGTVAHSGEGMWTVDAARELGVAVPVIESSLEFRLRSAKVPTYTGRVVSALRHEFGGHEVEEKKSPEGRPHRPGI
jgi:6-phosphogluconate dehydrogenase